VRLGSLFVRLGAAACFAETSIVVKAVPEVHPVSLNAVGIGVGGVMLLVLTFATGEALGLPSPPTRGSRRST
jgi:hypothetical protein